MEEVKDKQPEKSQHHNRKQPLPRTREEGIRATQEDFLSSETFPWDTVEVEIPHICQTHRKRNSPKEGSLM